MVGDTLPTSGPGLSALSRCMLSPLPFERGMMAMTNTSTPMPPIQWVKLRQNRSPRQRPSMLVRMLAPVVVKPDAVSKRASTYRGISREMVKGMAPKRDMSTHPRPTITKPSRACMLWSPRWPTYSSRDETTSSNSMVIKNPFTAFQDRSTRAMTRAGSINMASQRRIWPMKYRTARPFIGCLRGTRP